MQYKPYHQICDKDKFQTRPWLNLKKVLPTVTLAMERQAKLVWGRVFAKDSEVDPYLHF